jgi:serine/threonine-protein kinase
MLSAASAGLHAAHELRDDEGRPLEIVHRDVNPQNVMVSYEGIVKIVDFGVAKAAALVHNTRVPGMIKGKVHYLSPEQIRGDKLDRRSDIFSLGILMYVMISGRHPFKADTDKQTMDNIVGRDPVPLHKLVPDVRPELEAVVMRALEKDVSKRWPDCAEIQRALDQIIGLLGTTVTDGDVSKFVRKVMGDRSEQRRAELAAAIQAADARGPGADGPASRRRAGPASVRPGSERNRGAMPSIFEGIIPVALEDTPPPPSATPLPPPIATPVVVEPLPSLRPPAPRRRSGPGVVGGALLLLLGAAGATGSALYLGYLPDLAERLPGPLRALAPAASAAPSATPTAVPSAAPTASSTTTAIATAAAPVDVNAALNTASTDAGATDAGATDAGSADAGPLDAGRLPPWGTDGGPPPGWFKPRNKQGTTGASGSSNSP